MSTKKGKKSRSKGAEVVNIYRDFSTQPAQITDEQIAEIEKRCADGEYLISRQVALKTLCLPGSRLIEIAEFRKSALALAGISLHMDQYVEHLRSVADLINTASTRLQLSLCGREDMYTLLEEAKARESRQDLPKAASFLRLVIDNTKKPRS